MTLIIAARFPTFDVAHAAAQRLMQAGVHESALHVFFVNPPGAHDHYAVGGDQAADPGTRGAPNKALGVAALLGAIGAVAGGVIVSTFAESFIPIIVGILREAGGEAIERAQGRWRGGAWEDFDPLKPPVPQNAPDASSRP